MLEKYTEIILTITAFELLLLAILILFKRTNSPHFKILGVFLLTKGLCVASALLGNFYIEWIYKVPYLFPTGSYLTFTFGPLIYLFTRSITSGKGVRFIDSIHFSPVIIALGYFTFSLFIKPAELQAEILTRRGLFPSWTFFYSYWGAFYLLTFVYLGLSVFIIRKYHKNLRNELSSLKKLKVKWLYPVFTVFFLIILIDALIMYFPVIRETFGLYKVPVLETVFLIFANLFVYIGLTQPVIQVSYPGSQGSKRYVSSKLTLPDKREILQNIRTRMSKDMLFLDPELSIEKLSTVSGVSSRNISQVINEILNQNFFEFVNSYRITAAKEQLEDVESNKTVLEILYAVGFNSKSVFNSCFKKSTGHTPTEYRKQKLGQSQVG